ncbi:MAG: glutathione S-transferase family protein [Caulobacter sp.]|nr:glutathione S-transferase family protein [Caulobacter sp.]
MTAPYILHGLKQSYFTGKMEAYLRVKGVPFDFVIMDSGDFRDCGRATGVLQMPQLQVPDGSWLTDTTAIIRHFESALPAPALQPATPVGLFLSRFVEDAADEWLWRPALYYRWAFVEDSRLMGRQLGRDMLSDQPGPLALRAWWIRARQRRMFLGHDGVTPLTAPQVEAVYKETLDALEPVFAARPFLFGERPVGADFGLFGPMFRHFFSDPTPAAIMRERAPNVLAWVTRLWALTPEAAARAPLPADAPADLDPFLRLAAGDHLTELAANHEAVAAGRPRAEFDHRGVRWSLPVSPYRARCLRDLRTDYEALSEAERVTIDSRLGPASAHLKGPVTELPAATAPRPGNRPIDRRWRRW